MMNVWFTFPDVLCAAEDICAECVECSDHASANDKNNEKA